jgi:hypothetical protein
MTKTDVRSSAAPIRANTEHDQQDSSETGNSTGFAALGVDPRIAEALNLGMVVRTRADADTVEARTGDRSRRDAAFASGAQYISTDYMTPDRRLSDYSVALPGGGTSRRAPGVRP